MSTSTVRESACTSAAMVEIREQEETLRKLYEERTKPSGSAHTIAELRAAFDGVCDKEDWKRPFMCVVGRGRIGLVVEAIRFFHGTDPVYMDEAGDLISIRSKGYGG